MGGGGGSEGGIGGVDESQTISFLMMTLNKALWAHQM